MKILGIDYGERKIGLAISEGVLAEPLKIVKSNRQIVSICQKEGIEKIVVGISEGKMAERARKFGRGLGKITGLPVKFQDETLTSQEAVAKMKEIGKRVKDEDAISAALILQEYLETQKRRI
ncbi:MAG: Holliday junction resolvase RuvX [Patescibacteria group bacterium]